MLTSRERFCASLNGSVGSGSLTPGAEPRWVWRGYKVSLGRSLKWLQASTSRFWVSVLVFNWRTLSVLDTKPVWQRDDLTACVGKPVLPSTSRTLWVTRRTVCPKRLSSSCERRLHSHHGVIGHMMSAGVENVKHQVGSSQQDLMIRVHDRTLTQCSQSAVITPWNHRCAIINVDGFQRLTVSHL